MVPVGKLIGLDLNKNWNTFDDLTKQVLGRQAFTAEPTESYIGTDKKFGMTNNGFSIEPITDIAGVLFKGLGKTMLTAGLFDVQANKDIRKKLAS